MNTLASAPTVKKTASLSPSRRRALLSAHIVSAVAPLAVLGLTTGVALATTSRWGLFRHAWVTTKLIITTLGTAAILAALVPGTGRAAALARVLTGSPSGRRSSSCWSRR